MAHLQGWVVRRGGVAVEEVGGDLLDERRRGADVVHRVPVLEERVAVVLHGARKRMQARMEMASGMRGLGRMQEKSRSEEPPLGFRPQGFRLSGLRGLGTRLDGHVVVMGALDQDRIHPGVAQPLAAGPRRDVEVADAGRLEVHLGER